ncbi:MAG: glycoside hydrolase [Oscillospiraceae bacterium]|jgi:hypothetical protein|nr:glycoside hydrolase [Oscillospiraceae bacterium]
MIKVLKHERKELYWPKVRPGFTAWAAVFDYGDGRVGFTFKEVVRERNPDYTPLPLEIAEGGGSPVSYGSSGGKSPDHVTYQVYMATGDGGKSFWETGRTRIKSNSFCHMGFPDSSIIRMTTPELSPDRMGMGSGLVVEKSTDGGNTFTRLTSLLEDTAPYLWRTRKLKDGTVLLLTCLYGTPWGKGRARTTRNTILPGESYIAKTITCFLASSDQGETWSGPHYILPGTGAHEYDVVELPDDELLFIAGDVQATPVARQIVKRQGGHYINGTLYGIGKGAPPDPERNAQGGYVPESVVRLPDGLLVGSRRNQPYTCSNDNGANWHQIEGLPNSLYQPAMISLPDGTVMNFYHKGGDSAFGQHDMFMGADIFTLENNMPKQTALTLRRELAPDGSRFSHTFSATLTGSAGPLAGRELTFFSASAWREDGSANTDSRDAARFIKRAVTDSGGTASVTFDEYSVYGDIHHYYTVEVAYLPPAGSVDLACDGPLMNAGALVPVRNCPYPYGAYFAEGVLYLSPAVMEEHPGLLEKLQFLVGSEAKIPEEFLTESEAALLRKNHVVRERGGVLEWIASVHAPRPLDGVQRMLTGDNYV